jgi:hypothetical protein
MMPVVPSFSKSPKCNEKVFAWVNGWVIGTRAEPVRDTVYGPSSVQDTNISEAATNKDSEGKVFSPTEIRDKLQSG